MKMSKYAFDKLNSLAKEEKILKATINIHDLENNKKSLVLSFWSEENKIGSTLPLAMTIEIEDEL